MTRTDPGSSGAVRGRTSTVRPAVLGAALALAVADLAAKYAAERALGPRTTDLGIIQLQLTHNAGVSFGFGAQLPGWVVLGGTGMLTALLVWYAWRAAPTLRLPSRLGMAGLVGGATGNLVDRAADGKVTDYLHTGWWPTFNLADVLICAGVGVIVLSAVLRPDPPAPR